MESDADRTASELPPKRTLPQLIRKALDPPRPDVLIERVDGAWTAMPARRLLERVENVACAIREAGLAPGDRVALLAHDCVDWLVTDFGALFAGCVVVPIYPTQALDHMAHILGHSDAKMLFADSAATLERVRSSGAAIGREVRFDSHGDDGIEAFEARGAAVRAQNADLPAAYEAAIHPDDLAVLMYTSGTTGDPKGVMLSHDNIGFDAQSALTCGLEDHEGHNVLSVLPYSHIFEHTIAFVYLLGRVRYHICHDAVDLLSDMRDVRPEVMTAVPRIFDRVIAGVEGKAMKSGGAQSRLVPWALGVGRSYMYAKTFGGGASPWLTMRYAMASRLVLRKVRAALGLDRMRFFVSGSAAMHVDTAMTFLGLGVPILQGYGLTETSPIVSVNRLAANEYGSSGQAIPGVDVRIAADGEILTRGRHVMRGYYRDPEATAATIVDGWLHTGDVGAVDADGFLRITDRKREVFKTDAGKWISPARVEAAIKRSVFVAQVMVVGDGRPHPAALVAPNWDLLRHELALPPDLPADELAARDDVLSFVTGVVAKQTRDLASFEQVRRVIVIPHEFSVEGGELSPAMKIKRRVVEKRYAHEIDSVYARDLHARGEALTKL